VNAVIYLEGGGDSKELRARCREGFRKLLENCGFKGRMPRLVACGGRGSTFDDFKIGYIGMDGHYVAMLIDSEDPMENIEEAWKHLEVRDRWDKPNGAGDNQVLFMTTCMETWIVSDRMALARYYGDKLQETALPPLENLEQRPRQYVQNQLSHATRNSSKAYEKGKLSFEILGKLSPNTLITYLPSFARAQRILEEML
jgi:hypothetical protein